MVSPVVQFMLAALMMLLHSSAHAEIDWTGVAGLSKSDQADLVELTQNLEMYNPSSASELTRFPSNRKLVVISTDVVVGGLRRTWREIHVCRISAGFCSTPRKESVGDWRVIEGVRTQERWRFSDDDWFVDVELGSGISYAEAEAIIIAIHRNLLVSTPELKDWGTFDASNVSSIGTLDPIAREFAVNINSGGSGYMLQVRLRGSEVQLYELVTWTA